MRRDRWLVPAFVVSAVLALAGALFFLSARQEESVDSRALATEPKRVSIVAARAATYRPTRRYVGTLRAWHRADMGPQLVAAYLKTVRVRTGDPVKQGQVLATLDCRNVSASSDSVTLQIAALEREQKALASEVKRLEKLARQNFVSPNELEKKAAESAAAEARLGALRAQLRAQRVEVDDCVLRAPFDGEVAARRLDPGEFVRPGTTVLTVVDRSRLRLELEVPERDYYAVASGTPVELRLVVTDEILHSRISRRSPAAHSSTRTVRVEIDLDDPEHELPVGTTAEVRLEVGDPVPAIEVPLRAASVRAGAATLFVADAGVARKVQAHVLGEKGARLFIQPVMVEGTAVIVEGRSGLSEGDSVLSEPDRFDVPSEPGSVTPADHRTGGATEARQGDEESTSL